MIVNDNVTDLFEELLDGIKCHPDTKAYVVSIFGKYRTAHFDLSKDSVTSLLAQGREKQDFLTYQTLGDWLFYSKSMFPESLKNASENYYDSVARLSYYNCYRIVKTWQIYQELADRFTDLTNQTRIALTDIRTIETYEDKYILPFGS